MYTSQEIRALYWFYVLRPDFHHINRLDLAFARDVSSQSGPRVTDGYIILDKSGTKRSEPVSFVSKKFGQVVPLIEQGLTTAEIKRRTGVDRKTIVRYRRMIRPHADR